MLWRRDAANPSLSWSRNYQWRHEGKTPFGALPIARRYYHGWNWAVRYSSGCWCRAPASTVRRRFDLPLCRSRTGCLAIPLAQCLRPFIHLLFIYPPAGAVVARATMPKRGSLYMEFVFLSPIAGVGSDILGRFHTQSHNLHLRVLVDCISLSSGVRFPDRNLMAHAVFWPSLALCLRSQANWSNTAAGLRSAGACVYARRGLVLSAVIIFAVPLRAGLTPNSDEPSAHFSRCSWSGPPPN